MSHLFFSSLVQVQHNLLGRPHSPLDGSRLSRTYRVWKVSPFSLLSGRQEGIIMLILEINWARGRRCPGVCFNRLPCPCLSRPHVVLSGLLKSLLVHMALLKQFSLHSLHDEQPGLEMPPPLVTNQLRASRGPSLRSWSLEAWCQLEYSSIHPPIHPHRTCNFSSSPRGAILPPETKGSCH